MKRSTKAIAWIVIIAALVDLTVSAVVWRSVNVLVFLYIFGGYCLLRREPAGWWIVIVVHAVSAVFFGVVLATGLSSSGGPAMSCWGSKLEGSAQVLALLLGIFFSALVVVILLLDYPGRWDKSGRDEVARGEPNQP